MVPETSVPVTTVPKPFMVNTRSMGRRAIAFESLRRNLASDLYQFPLQIVNPGSGQRTDGHDGVGSIKARDKKRPAQEVLHFSRTTSSVS